MMAQILVRDLDNKVVQRLKSRAKGDGRSLQAEVKFILEKAALEPRVDMETARTLVEKIRGKFKGRKFPDSTELIREDRDR
jgi:plasmid stability protein